MGTINNVVKVRALADIEILEKLSISELATKHLHIICNFDEISDVIEKMCKKSLVYSVISSNETPNFNRIASNIDTIPFFLVHDENEVIDLVSDLTQHPFQTIKKSINGDSVVLRYHEGLPS